MVSIIDLYSFHSIYFLFRLNIFATPHVVVIVVVAVLLYKCFGSAPKGFKRCLKVLSKNIDKKLFKPLFLENHFHIIKYIFYYLALEWKNLILVSKKRLAAWKKKWVE